MSDLIERLRGRYPMGNGDPPEFGYRQFEVSAIQQEAADEIECLQHELFAWRNTATLAQNEEKSLRRQLDDALELLKVMPDHGLSAYDLETWRWRRSRLLEGKR